MPPRKKEMSKWKVVKDAVHGDLGPRPLSLSEQHRDRTLDWRKFHATFPQLEYFTEDMIDLDSDAFKKDEYYAMRAKHLLKYFDPFVDIVANLSTLKTEKLLVRSGNTSAPDVQQRLRYLKRIPGAVTRAIEKAKKTYGVEESYYNLARCSKE